MHCENLTTCILLVVSLTLSIFYFFVSKNLVITQQQMNIGRKKRMNNAKCSIYNEQIEKQKSG
jgi:hypothetical protein